MFLVDRKQHKYDGLGGVGGQRNKEFLLLSFKKKKSPPFALFIFNPGNGSELVYPSGM